MMTRPMIVKALLLTAGVASAAMAAFHFFLPTVFQWSRYTAPVPTSIRWALDAINAFFSTLLLWEHSHDSRRASAAPRHKNHLGDAILIELLAAVRSPERGIRARATSRPAARQKQKYSRVAIPIAVLEVAHRHRRREGMRQHETVADPRVARCWPETTPGCRD